MLSQAAYSYYSYVTCLTGWILALVRARDAFAEIRSILEAEGYDVSRPLATLYDELNNDPRFLFEDSDAGRQAILDEYGVLIDSGATTASQLAMSVAEHSINATNLDLVGLAQNGVEYVLSV